MLRISPITSMENSCRCRRTLEKLSADPQLVTYERLRSLKAMWEADRGSQAAEEAHELFDPFADDDEPPPRSNRAGGRARTSNASTIWYQKGS
ncbi:hypothetical protein V7S43_013731 [Phytophthora oleae]|uniref:Uncharacterized protein n=1 Tax=Phytophthora oleae TaxID=2107226 RepID=A0ABD3F3R5_9STRA